MKTTRQMDVEALGKERTATTLSALALIEAEGTKLLDRLGKLEKGTPVSGELLDSPERAIRQAVNLAWAARTFPIFDMRALARLKEQEVVIGRYAVKLFLPAFAGCSFPVRYSGGMDINFTNCLPYATDSIGVSYDRSIFNDANRDRLIVLDASIAKVNPGADERRTLQSFALRAKAPEVPASVTSRVGKVEGRFDVVSLIWEAEWQPRPIADPLIIGRIFGHWFLIDQYDETKLERYIVSEFSTKAK